MIQHLTIYTQSQRSVSMQEVVCPLRNEAVSKGVQVRLVDGQLAFMKECQIHILMFAFLLTVTTICSVFVA